MTQPPVTVLDCVHPVTNDTAFGRTSAKGVVGSEFEAGAPGGNRTPCLAVRSRTLCPVSYRRGYAQFTLGTEMRSFRGAPLGAALILAWLCCSGCDLQPFSSAGPSPQEVVTQSGDVPSDLRRCP